jgi:hypothetical protein
MSLSRLEESSGVAGKSLHSGGEAVAKSTA